MSSMSDASYTKLAQRISGIINAHRFTYANEKELQFGLGLAFVGAGLVFANEYRLSNGSSIPDFMFEFGLVGEVKIGGSRNDLIRQIHRYAEFDDVCAILVITSKNSHRPLPESIDDKPVFLHLLYKNPF